MLDLFGVDTNIWIASAAAVQTIIVGAAAVFAYRQVREVQRTREEQSRPFVVVDLDISDPPLVFLSVSNLGRTIARRVRIQFEPSLANSFDNRPLTEDQKKAGVSLPLLVPFEVFTEEIPSMAPGKAIRTLFDSMFGERREDLPESYRVTVRYEDDRSRPHTEEMLLGFAAYKNLEYIQRHTIHDVHDQLEKIADAVKHWSASGSGILVVPKEEERRERERLREQRMSQTRAAVAPGENEMRPQARARAWLHGALRDLADRVGPER